MDENVITNYFINKLQQNTTVQIDLLERFYLFIDELKELPEFNVEISCELSDAVNECFEDDLKPLEIQADIANLLARRLSRNMTFLNVRQSLCVLYHCCTKKAIHDLLYYGDYENA